MKFKALKHKTLEDTFGHIIHVPCEDSEGYQYEIAHCVIPLLQPMTATMEISWKYWNTHLPDSKTVLEQLKDYEMVVVEVKIIFESENI